MSTNKNFFFFKKKNNIQPQADVTGPIENKKGKILAFQRKRARKTTKLVDTKEEFEVKRILSEKTKHNNQKEYLVKWLSYTNKDNTWKPEHHLQNAPKAIVELAI